MQQRRSICIVYCCPWVELPGCPPSFMPSRSSALSLCLLHSLNMSCPPPLPPTLQHGIQQQVVMRRAGIAHIYVTRGTFLVDALSSAAWFAQVGVWQCKVLFDCSLARQLHGTFLVDALSSAAGLRRWVRAAHACHWRSSLAVVCTARYTEAALLSPCSCCFILLLLQLAVVILSWSGSNPTEHIELAHALRVARILRILRVRAACR